MNRDTTRINGGVVEFDSEKPVQMLVGFFIDDQNKFASPPKLEIDATGNLFGQAEPVLTHAIAMSGMPMIQFSLPTMLSLVDEGVLSIEKLVQLMAHNPAKLFDVGERGFIREGYKADITIVKPQSPWTVTKECIQSKCGWSPMEGRTYNWQVRDTICNGSFALRDGKLSENNKGEQIRFNHSK